MLQHLIHRIDIIICEPSSFSIGGFFHHSTTSYFPSSSSSSSSECHPSPLEWLIVFNSSNYIIRFRIAFRRAFFVLLDVILAVFFLLVMLIFTFLSLFLSSFPFLFLEQNFFSIHIAMSHLIRIDPFHTWKLWHTKFVSLWVSAHRTI